MRRTPCCHCEETLSNVVITGAKPFVSMPLTTLWWPNCKSYDHLHSPKHQPPKCSNVSPFRIWIELTDLALARYASHASHWFVASGAHPALHTQCCIPDPHHLERFQTMLCFCSLAATTSMWPVTPSQVDSLFMVDLNASFSSLVHRATCDFVQFVVEGDRFPKISSEIDLTHQN